MTRFLSVLIIKICIQYIEGDLRLVIDIFLEKN